LHALWLVSWGILLVIAISDLKDNKIPNKLVVFLFFSLFFNRLIIGIDDWYSAFFGGLVVFFSGLVFYLLKAMAAGDVKLLAVIGFWVGWGNLLETSYYILLAAAVVGCLYFIHNQIYQRANVSLSNLILSANKSTRKYADYTVTKMPLAPAIAIGLALHSYYI